MPSKTVVVSIPYDKHYDGEKNVVVIKQIVRESANHVVKGYDYQRSQDEADLISKSPKGCTLHRLLNFVFMCLQLSQKFLPLSP